jgi:Rho-binding antiterminator
MATEPSDDQPISCDFHDILETLATTGKPARLLFVDSQGQLQQRQARVADIYSRQGAEYMKLSNGETLRLDQLRSVDDSKLADFD